MKSEKQKKQMAWEQALEYIMANTEFKQKSKIASVLGHDKAQYYSIKKGLSTPDNPMVDALVARFPFPEVVNILKPYFPISTEPEMDVAAEIMKLAYEKQPVLLDTIEKQKHALGIMERRMAGLEQQVAMMKAKIESYLENHPDAKPELLNGPLAAIL